MADPIAQPRINLAAARILLIDSSAQGRQLVAQMLYGMGAREMTRAETLDAAWRAVRNSEFELILCSSTLSDGDGYDFVRALRTSDLEPNRFAPIVLLTGHTSISAMQRARDCGANIVVAKPVSAASLLERIVWLGRDKRPFIEVDGVYAGPDRRFKQLGPPPGAPGRRREDEG